MIVISTRKFREELGKYLGMAKDGQDIILKSRENGSFKLVPLSQDDALMSKEDFFSKIDNAKKEAIEGKGVTINSKEALNAYMDNL